MIILLFLFLFTGCKEEGSLNNYAIYCIKNNLWEEARFYLEKVRSLKTSAEIENNLGVVYEYLGRKEDAISCYKKAIEFSPDEVYYKNLACISDFKIPPGLKNKVKALKVKIIKNIPPKIDISKIDKVGVCIYCEDKNIIPHILTVLRERIIEETPFYIIYKDIPYPKVKEEIKDACLGLVCDNILLLSISSYNVFDVKDFDISTKFIKNENRYEFLRRYWTERKVNISFSLSFFNKEGEAILKKDFKKEVKKRYDTENPPSYDYSIFNMLLKEGIDSFLSLMKKEEYIIERWLVRD